MAKWRWKNGQPLEEIKDFTLDHMNMDIDLEPGDMIELLSGEFPYRSISERMNWTMRSEHNRLSVVQSKYVKSGGTITNRSLLMPLEGSDQDIGLIQMIYDPYVQCKLRLFPVDSVDKW